MRFGGVTLACLALACLLSFPIRFAAAQVQPPSEKLLITASRAYTWTDPTGASVVQLEGPVTIELDRATLTARQAVIWLTREREAPPSRQRAEVVLIGDAAVRQRGVARSGDRLYVTAEVEGRIRFTAEERVPADQSDSPLYRDAAAIRAGTVAGTTTQPAGPQTRPTEAGPPAEPVVPEGSRQRPQPQDAAPATVTPAPGQGQPDPLLPPRDFGPAGPPAGPPTGREPGTGAGGAPTAPPGPMPAGVPLAPSVAPGPARRYLEISGNLETVDTADGTVAAVFDAPITLVETRADGTVLELRADRAVMFTPLESLKDAAKLGDVSQVRDAVTAAYLEGDVRIIVTPASGAAGEQRLEAERVYYEFATDRAILTDAVIHTLEPRRQIPITVRAKTVRQLSQGEFRARGVALSTSSFALPSYEINAGQVYVRNVDTGDPRQGSRTHFRAQNATFRAFGFPFFYLPYAAGSLTERGQPLRSIGGGNSTAFGTSIETEWGLFETLGRVPPRDLDITYDLNYYSDRGPAGGVGADYSGGFLTDVDKERWTFKGEIDSFFVYDEGLDDFGRGLLRQGEDQELRGRALWEHQHFFPGDYQLQLRAGYVSDETFLEQWFERDFDEDLPHDLSAYVKRQRDNEAYTLFANVQPNNVVTTSDFLQEQFEVEHLPEVGYRRYGDSFWNDRLTTFSENTAGFLRFNTTGASLEDQGFVIPGRPPGIPSVGFTGVDEDAVFRGDFRQEIDYPLALGRFKLVPYVMGRYTGYTDSPDGGTKNRLTAGTGARLGTAFWRVDDTVRSRLFDLNRLRHVIEPELHLFTSASTVDRGELFIYEEDVDAVNDLSAAQIALRQRWQTKRGGPGRWRSVDVFTLNVEANFFANQPDEDELEPTGFRGLFFWGLPEASVPRNAVNADASWRISDNTVVLADAQYSIDEEKLATAAVGLVVRRDERLSYFVGNRYIDELNSNITTVAGTYQINPKYTVALGQSFDFGLGENVSSSAAVIRRFDRFIVQARVFHNSTNDQSGFGFNIFPTGLGYGLDSDVVGSVFRERR